MLPNMCAPLWVWIELQCSVRETLAASLVALSGVVWGPVISRGGRYLYIFCVSTSGPRCPPSHDGGGGAPYLCSIFNPVNSVPVHYLIDKQDIICHWWARTKADYEQHRRTTNNEDLLATDQRTPTMCVCVCARSPSRCLLTGTNIILRAHGDMPANRMARAVSIIIVCGATMLDVGLNELCWLLFAAS